MIQSKPSNNLLSIKSLEKSFGGEMILRGVDLDLNAGETIAIMGPSGSGKSTLLNCIGGLMAPDGGNIQFDGRDYDQLGEQDFTKLRRTHLSSIFQFFHLLPTLSVYENIELPLILNRYSSTESREKTEAIINEVGLWNRRNAPPSELSGGEKQRTAIVRAMVHQPKLLLADEPTGSLDSKNGSMILELLHKIIHQHQVAMIMVTHSEDAAQSCKRSIHMMDGQWTN